MNPRPSSDWGVVEDKLREDIWEAIDNYVDVVIDMRRCQDRALVSSESMRCLGNNVQKAVDEINKHIAQALEPLRKPFTL